MKKTVKHTRKFIHTGFSEAAVIDDDMLVHEEGSAASLADLDFEMQAANIAAGKEEKTYGIWGPIYRFSCWYKSRVKEHTVNKKTYLILMVLLGWMGGHRYYEHRWVLGMIYTAFFWTGIPFAMCVIDAMIVLPKQKDEAGMITL
ncbi:MAG: NINE protein [Solobacterium sp.]|jgi:TM2 domain-containing membrane protein YozV|nr:NINE protein [Solobacterium sp.]MCH4221852.1 NINE protein [Solobacterium sp.]MCH4265175.1 NINE protein [Solobacterium sp.]